jgi:hypothetical protein
MNHRVTAFRSLFQRLVLAGVVPMAGCGSTVITLGGDAAPADSNLPADASDATPADASDATPADGPNCARQIGPDDACMQAVTYPCNDAPRTATGDPDCETICVGVGPGRGAASCFPTTTDGGPTVYQCVYCAIGRRVEGFAPRESVGGDVVGDYFAAVAQLEAASVVAFERLARELAAYGAPNALIAEARRAADDERRHARDTRRLAHDRGARVAPLPKLAGDVRSLRAMAVDNATEGCVRETFGALVATWQAARAADADIARVMDVIAQEETRHAALSWSVAAWLDGVLAGDDRAAVATARAAAIDGLLAELATPIDPALVAKAGMPDADAALSLARAMLRELPTA